MDGFHNLPDEGFFICVYSIFPDEDFYGSAEETDIKVNCQLDWNSPIKSPRFLENYANYKNIQFKHGTIVVLDVRRVLVKKEKQLEIQEYGWTIYPLFSYSGYVNSGIYQLPLMRGGVQKKIIQELSTQKTPWEGFVKYQALVSEDNQRPLLSPLGYASAIVRVLDGNIEGHFK